MLSEETIIIAIFCAIATVLGILDYKHSQGRLYLSEILLCGVLFALKGSSFRRFYVWLKRRNLFDMPDRTRLQRLLITHQKQCRQFLEDPTVLNITDSFGVEVIHPFREGRSEQSKKVSKKGLSNHRWIIGRKINVVINQDLSIVSCQSNTANVSDKNFNASLSKISGIVLADSGYREREGISENMKICRKGTWNCRMYVETLFSLWERICNAKRSFHRTVAGFAAKSAFLATLTNIVFSLNESFGFNRFSLAQWAL